MQNWFVVSSYSIVLPASVSLIRLSSHKIIIHIDMELAIIGIKTIWCLLAIWVEAFHLYGNVCIHPF